MASDVKDKVMLCTECVHFGPKLPVEPTGWIFVHQPFDLLLFDFVSVLPKSNGRSAFIVGIDAYSGFGRAEPVRKMTADVAESFSISAFMFVFGAPRVVHTDNGTHLLGIFHDFVTGLGVRHCFSSPHFPWAHGKVKCVHRMLLDQLQKAHLGFSSLAYLQVVAWHVNTRSPKEGRAPLELLMGVRPREKSSGASSIQLSHRMCRRMPSTRCTWTLCDKTWRMIEPIIRPIRDTIKPLKSHLVVPLKGHSGLTVGDGIGISLVIYYGCMIMELGKELVGSY